jgi:hypothetical protein
VTGTSSSSALGKHAGLTDEALSQARLGKSEDARLGAMLRLTRAIVERRGRVGEGTIDDARRSDFRTPTSSIRAEPG